MSKLRAGFGRYELGSHDGDMRRITYLLELEKSKGSATDAFRELVDRHMEARQNQEAVKKES